MTDSFEALVDYMRWADDLVLTPCGALTAEEYGRVLGGSFPSVRATVAHLAAAAAIWSTRLAGGVPGPLLTDKEVPTMPAARAHLDAAYPVLARVGRDWNASPDEIFSYTNTQGIATSLPRWVIFRHIVNHATYHRGQLANMLRMLGSRAPSSDLLFWGRERVR